MKLNHFLGLLALMFTTSLTLSLLVQGCGGEQEVCQNRGEIHKATLDCIDAAGTKQFTDAHHTNWVIRACAAQARQALCIRQKK